MSFINDATRISVSALKAQSIRLRVLSENLANANSTGKTPDADPYRRKLVIFDTHVDNETQANLVDVKKIRQDMSQFKKKYEPSHPAADDKGFVNYPNVNPLIELMDMREAQRSYEANLTAIQTAKQISRQTLSLLDKK